MTLTHLRNPMSSSAELSCKPHIPVNLASETMYQSTPCAIKQILCQALLSPIKSDTHVFLRKKRGAERVKRS